MNSKAGFMLSLAAKAGKVQSGEFSAEKAIKEKKAFLCLVAGDASENTKKRFSDMCQFRKLPILEFEDRAALGRQIGKEYRAVVAITDPSFAGQLIALLSKEDTTKKS